VGLEYVVPGDERPVRRRQSPLLALGVAAERACEPPPVHWPKFVWSSPDVPIVRMIDTARVKVWTCVHGPF
jgi:hypothetical protein